MNGSLEILRKFINQQKEAGFIDSYLSSSGPTWNPQHPDYTGPSNPGMTQFWSDIKDRILAADPEQQQKTLDLLKSLWGGVKNTAGNMIRQTTGGLIDPLGTGSKTPTVSKKYKSSGSKKPVVKKVEAPKPAAQPKYQNQPNDDIIEEEYYEEYEGDTPPPPSNFGMPFERYRTPMNEYKPPEMINGWGGQNNDDYVVGEIRGKGKNMQVMDEQGNFNPLKPKKNEIFDYEDLDEQGNIVGKGTATLGKNYQFNYKPSGK